MSKKLLKSTAIVSLMTLISRVSGLIRDVIMANVLGSGVMADAFFVAFRIPNFLRRIFAEGAFSQAFVPVFSELTQNNISQSKQFVNATCGVLALVTLVLSLLGVFFAEQVVLFFAPGFASQADKLAATIQSLQIMFPFLFCISLVAMSAGILNTLNHFAIPAITPVLLNVCLIVAMLVGLPYADSTVFALSLGVLSAGIIQLLFQIPSLVRLGYLPKPSLEFKNPALVKVFKLMLPAIFSVSVAQINMLVNTVLASFLVTGSVSWLYYSDRLMEFPVGVFGIALATVVLPSLSKEYVSGTKQGFEQMMDWALRWVVLIALPASVALYYLAIPLLSTLFQYNAFSAQDVVMSASALRAFAVGVCGIIFVKVLAPGFFARQDTKTPMRIAVVAMMTNVLMSVLLVKVWKHAGLALAISLAAWVNAILLLVVLLKQGIYRFQSGWCLFLARVVMAVVVMLFVLQYFNVDKLQWFDMSLFERLRWLSVLVVLGLGSYFMVIFLLGIRPKQLLLRPVKSGLK